MYFTKNNTTTEVGQAVATVIADSEHNGNRITTLELVYPRYIHSELLTHRSFSRSASSSRATPVKVLVQEARNPVFFDSIGLNQSGMQSFAELPPEVREEFHKEWVELANCIADWVEETVARYNIHKQVLNRALEPFTRIRTLVTATDWDNFFELRLSSDAQPEMRSLAQAMQQAMQASKPEATEHHTPYSPDKDIVESVARCARVSYMRLDGRPDNHDDDVKLYHRLLESKHMSPFEHVATWREGRFANFTGWQSLRNKLETDKA